MSVTHIGIIDRSKQLTASLTLKVLQTFFSIMKSSSDAVDGLPGVDWGVIEAKLNDSCENHEL